MNNFQISRHPTTNTIIVSLHDSGFINSSSEEYDRIFFFLNQITAWKDKGRFVGDGWYSWEIMRGITEEVIVSVLSGYNYHFGDVSINQ